VCLLYWMIRASFVCRFPSSGSICYPGSLDYLTPLLASARWRLPLLTLCSPRVHSSRFTCSLSRIIFYTIRYAVGSSVYFACFSCFLMSSYGLFYSYPLFFTHSQGRFLVDPPSVHLRRILPSSCAVRLTLFYYIPLLLIHCRYILTSHPPLLFPLCLACLTYCVLRIFGVVRASDADSSMGL